MKKINICMYGAASDSIDSIYIKEGEDLGAEIAARNHTLIYGGGSYGMMGACARGVTAGNGEIIGVIPYFMDEYEGIYRKCSELILTETMAERKQLMEEKADAFIIAPGGVGTMDEFFQTLTLAELERHTCPIVVFNIDGYYDSLLCFIKEGIEKGFIRSGLKDLYMVKSSAKEVIEAIEEKFSSQES